MSDILSKLRTLTAEQLVGSARYFVRRRMPYFDHILWKMRPVERPGIGRITASKLRLFYDPALVAGLDPEHIGTKICHLVQHIRREHKARGEAAMLRHASKYRAARGRLTAMGFPTFQSLWERCACMEIDGPLVEHKWRFHSDHPARLPRDFGLRPGMTAEAMLLALIATPDPPMNVMPCPSPRREQGREDNDERDANDTNDTQGDDNAQDDDPDAPDAGSRDPDAEDASGTRSCDENDEEHVPDAGDGPSAIPAVPTMPDALTCGGCAGNPDPFEDIVNDDEPEPATDREEDVALRQVAAAVREFDPPPGFRGDRPDGDLLSWAKKFLLPPKADPFRVFENLVRAAVSNVRGNTHLRHAPMTRRRSILMQMLGDSAPLMSKSVGADPRIVAVLDTSGSMGSGPRAKRLQRACSELMGIAKRANVPLYALTVDAAVHAESKVRNVEDLLAILKGGGGTNMVIGVEAAMDPKRHADVVVLITDGETPWPSSERPRVPLVTIIANENRRVFESLPTHIKRQAIYVEPEDA